ncbi:L-threonine synthase [Tindallia magadiensis]|uniref:L-threonine synthase n=1 Tax=Tindallia magadiensis TaxID=69895 RepID=A0A1I3FEL7_9FIRM|nr:threonine synthase [Tindallia magadiensis]SFI09620.1 L-threonine synthase [Tindallia magadiensis]
MKQHGETTFFCYQCDRKVPADTLKPTCICGGLWNINYRPPKFHPSLIDTQCWNIFRYRAFMPLEGETWQQISLGEGMTPIISLNENVKMKMDYFMPTLSFKDRGAAVMIAHAKKIGIESVVQDSSGNAGNSVAAYSGKAGIACEIFVPEGTSQQKISMIQSHGAKVQIVPGNRDQCADMCRKKVKEAEMYYASHVYNPFFFEGTKTYIYEVYEQLGRIPATIFIPLGNGTLFIGVVKALEEFIESKTIKEMPKIIAVQSENCAPIYRATITKEKEAVLLNPMPTLAEGIAIGAPMRGKEILDSIDRHKIQVVTAPEHQILEARNNLAKKGIYVEHTTAATYAAYLKYIEMNGPLKDCLIPMCGAGLKSEK